jgi:hypothetical protein
MKQRLAARRKDMAGSEHKASEKETESGQLRVQGQKGTEALTQAVDLALLQRAIAEPRAAAPADIKALQRTAGNRAVQRLLVQRQPQEADEAQTLDLPTPLIQCQGIDEDHRTDKMTETGAAATVVQRIPLPMEVTAGTPAATIITAMSANTADQLKVQFHAYAAQHWVYSKYYPRHTGVHLVDGSGIIGDCRAFADAFVRIAAKLGIMAHTEAAAAGEGKRWLMKPGLTTFDGQKGDYGQQWIFENHAWVVVGGAAYDPLFNKGTGDPVSAGHVEDTIMQSGKDEWRMESGAILKEGVAGELLSEGTLDKLRRYADAHPGTAEGKEARMIAEKRYTMRQTWTKKSGCYLTTACVEARGLSDDCHELTVLRQFRDGYIRSITGGEALISEYYETAPTIVTYLKAAPNGAKQLDEIYQRIVEVVKAIDEGRLAEALAAYIDVAFDLKGRCQAVQPCTAATVRQNEQ